MKTDGREYEFNFSNRSNAYATFIVADVYYRPVNNTVLNKLVETRTTEPVAAITVDTADIVLELWDGAVQDGDSISLRLNGKWITTGFPVRNALQKIPIRLQRAKMSCCSWPITWVLSLPIQPSCASAGAVKVNPSD
ncbi:hypothetical protein [Paraflavitalea speifideaquila]|uniref:hypothetical protein n=1 Tax=Paraflavitalea speifideaquila TaxID=3076558 RepID=UPI0028E69299|nr:hypothetical protein [Paraflavitalea speifideiaquila]